MSVFSLFNLCQFQILSLLSTTCVCLCNCVSSSNTQFLLPLSFRFFSSMSTASANYSGVRGNGCRWLRFQYAHCWCRERAILKIIVDARKESNGMLYFVCEKKGKVGGCNYFQWCYLKSVDVDWVGQIQRECGDEEEEVQSGQIRREGGDGKWKDIFFILVIGCSFFVAILALFVSLMK